MTVPITLNLPDSVYQQAQQLAESRRQEITEVLSETLALLLPPPLPELTLPSEITQASDEELLEMTELQLAPWDDARLSALLDRQQAGQLTAAEQPELARLMALYKTGLLKKAQALNAAVQRGLIPPLAS
ncbi:MAG: hypothetical protein AAGG51_28280 [Cyanobacteria bacterium P01_G01_bin.54]